MYATQVRFDKQLNIFCHQKSEVIFWIRLRIRTKVENTETDRNAEQKYTKNPCWKRKSWVTNAWWHMFPCLSASIRWPVRRWRGKGKLLDLQPGHSKEPIPSWLPIVRTHVCSWLPVSFLSNRIVIVSPQVTWNYDSKKQFQKQSKTNSKMLQTL